MSCKKDFSKISTSEWKPELAVPFIKTVISFENLFPEDTNLVTDVDSTLVYYYAEDSIFSLSADTLLNLGEEDISFEKGFSLGDLIVEPFGIESSLKMYDVLPYLDQAVQDTLTKYDGQQGYFPPFAIMDPVIVDADPIENFIDLTFSDGNMIITTTNTLPVDLNDIEFEVIDKVSEETITEISIEVLASGTQDVSITELAGKQLHNELSFRINSMNSPGSFPEIVDIDLSKGIDINMETTELKVISGNAIISEQLMYSRVEMIDFGLDEEKLKHIVIQSGSLNYILESEIDIGISINMILTSALIDGQNPETDITIPPNGSVNSGFNVANMTADLTSGENQDYNLLPIELTMIILPSDDIITFDSSDKINGSFALEDLKLQYADGYLGQKEIEIEQDIFDLELDFLNQVEGELILEEPSLKLKYKNGIGVPLTILPHFTATNSSSGQTQDLNMGEININSPSEPGEIVEDSVYVDKNNSSIVEFLSIRPDQVVYYGSGITNPDGEQYNFVDISSKLSANLEIEIPLILRATELSFVDTLGFSLELEDMPIEEGGLVLNVNNGFPFTFTMKMILVDSITGQSIDQIVFDGIASASVDADGVVINKTSSDIIVNFTPEFLDNMQLANRILLEAETSTFGQGEVPVVLKSDYEIDVAISFSAKISP
ncbi:MAG: hypothetical protein C0598_13935 [Marinilabiliales bacterium]|nr:MAG: hypothetical protein C0598_13935 [Marinilabiliales bacterium]